MELMLSDMDNFTLEELDDFTFQELDDMTYDDLVAAVQAKSQSADKLCNKETPLSESQVQAITAIVHTYIKEYRQESLAKTVTVGVAINAIWDFLKFLTSTTTEYLPEITNTLKQAYILLEQLTQQVPQ